MFQAEEGVGGGVVDVIGLFLPLRSPTVRTAPVFAAGDTNDIDPSVQMRGEPAGDFTSSISVA